MIIKPLKSLKSIGLRRIIVKIIFKISDYLYDTIKEKNLKKISFKLTL